MRRILSALLLLPALAHAQTAAPLTQQAKATPVAYPFASAPRPAALAAAPAPAPKVSVAPRAAFRDVVTAHLNTDVEDFADLHTAMIGFRIGEDTNSANPRLVHVVGRELPAGFTPDGKSNVSVRMVVDERGVPTQVSIVRSAGPVLDESTLEAVNQYRFQPATLNHVPVESDVTLDISLVKK
jgi:TonB family protein